MPRWGNEEQDLARVVKSWRPDVIHTLGFDPAAYLYLRARKRYGLENIGRWIIQARGATDMFFPRHEPSVLSNIKGVLTACDFFIADHQWNYDFALSEGLSSKKLTPFGIVSGTGGMDVEGLRKKWNLYPSRRERIIYIPKMYENQAVKGLSLAEGLRIAWPRIQPCKVIMTWVVQSEMQLWLRGCLGEEILRHCEIKDRVPRQQCLEYTILSRIVYAPSVLDGIPNTMLEAMCLGAFPIISPLEGVSGVVEDKRNVLFARNLYPEELAEALVRAMNDDALVDSAAECNLHLVREIADRKRVRANALSFYTDAARKAQR
jgi:glycosyltransferase involved in cell wall biosynthesis